ncbi:MAG: conjugal transfer protein TraF [Acidobacteriota bacterium]
MTRTIRLFGAAAMAALGAALPAYGQGLDGLGTRAAGLSAFVAVADDASAVAWNPAGLATGPFFNIALDFGRLTVVPEPSPDSVEPGARAGRATASLLALAVPPFGLSYLSQSVISLDVIGPADQGSLGRQDRQIDGRVLETRQLGATLLQSIGEFLTVGATVKLVRGHVAARRGAVTSWDDGFDQLEAIDAPGGTRGDLDLGAMVALGRVRAGAVVRNLTEPRFGVEGRGDEEMQLTRHARLGVAWGDRWPGTARMLLAADVDLTRVPHPGGERRDLAAGFERWLPGARFGVRGGVRTSTVGSPRPVVSGGMSVAVRRGVFVEGQVARGTAGALGWGLSTRLTY